MERITLFKVGGNELDSPDFVVNLCAALGSLERRFVLVHGGGKEISATLEMYKQPVEFLQGIRITSAESMAIMEMVVCGSINKRLVAMLVSQGCRALGLSGVDLGLLRCLPHTIDGQSLGRVGYVTSVDTSALFTMLDLGWLPVIAPVALGESDNLSYNVNADMVAQGVAIALAQHSPEHIMIEMVFVTNVPGVLRGEQVAASLTSAEIVHDIETGVISGGMIPKVRAALAVLEQGVTMVRITNLEGLATGGTTISHER